MRILISSQMPIVRLLLIGAMALVSFAQCVGTYSSYRLLYFDRGWAYFIAYAIVATLCMLVWKQKTAIALALGLFLLSVGLELLHWLIVRGTIDHFAIVVNLLGIIAGVLLGLNILALRSRTKGTFVTQNVDSPGQRPDSPFISPSNHVDSFR